MSRRISRSLALLCLGSLALGSVACDAVRVFFPARIYETESPILPADLRSPAVLLFTKTNGFRHREAIPAGAARFEEIADQHGLAIYHTESGAAFTEETLSRFVATIWHNTSGDTLNDEQKAALKGWIEDGGGFVGIHGAGGDPSYDWEWYVAELLKAQFIGHIMGPQFQQAKVVVEDRDHPATRELPASFLHTEEWYSFDVSPRTRGARVLASVDEASYSPIANFFVYETDLAMGDHPVLWSHCVGRGRVLFSALGHQAESYQQLEHRKILEGAVAWAARIEGVGCE